MKNSRNERTVYGCLLLLMFGLIPVRTGAQHPPDTLQQLDEVEIKANIGRQPLMTAPLSAVVLDAALLQLQADYTPVSLLNTVAGVRMEERSPGSYRLSLRGSLLRSPFGVRNVKIYLDGHPLTDAGGNTYFNALDLALAQQVEVLKGPDGSLYGANTGGVVLVNTLPEHAANTGYINWSAGSYGTLQGRAAVQQTVGRHQFAINGSYLQSDGYREHSAMKRAYIRFADQWTYRPGRTLSMTLLYAALDYQTPGGLTAAQYLAYPQGARQATAQLPGAKEQQAGIYNKILFGGLSHTALISERLSQVTAISFVHADFKNPFITNYETRLENTYSLRSYLKWKSRLATASLLHVEWDLGIEGQVTQADIANYDNIGGSPGSLQTADPVKNSQYFFFSRIQLRAFKRLHMEASASLNYLRYRFAVPGLKKIFEPQVMPRLAFSWQQTRQLVFRASLSRGYSPPTTAEVRPSDNNIYTALQPEHGWNLEGGLRLKAFSSRLYIDASVYHYRLQEAIVRQQHSNGTEFFINAGGTRQTGLELMLTGKLITPDQHSRLLASLTLGSSFTRSYYKFDAYNYNAENYSGNAITGVPANVWVSHLTADLQRGFYVFIVHNYTGRIPLNDANSVWAAAYHLLRCKAGWRHQLKKYTLEFYAAADNLLNQQYSLGNDLNAAGGRYFNAAPLRNYSLGILLGY